MSFYDNINIQFLITSLLPIGADSSSECKVKKKLEASQTTAKPSSPDSTDTNFAQDIMVHQTYTPQDAAKSQLTLENFNANQNGENGSSMLFHYHNHTGSAELTPKLAISPQYPPPMICVT